MIEDRRYWNEEMETLSPSAFDQVQSEALTQQLARVAENSKFYQ